MSNLKPVWKLVDEEHDDNSYSTLPPLIWREKDDCPEVIILLNNIKKEIPALLQLWSECCDICCYEDSIYRYYHGSFKVYALQNKTKLIADKLMSIYPANPLHSYFAMILKEGTGNIFIRSNNDRFSEITRPILEGFFHARYFLEMAIKYGQELEFPPTTMPSGWAALLCLYGLR